jgi:hypothetical protein
MPRIPDEKTSDNGTKLAIITNTNFTGISPSF